METLLTTVGSLVQACVGWMGYFLQAIMQEGNELLLVFVLLPLAGLGVGFLRRLMNL